MDIYKVAKDIYQRTKRNYIKSTEYKGKNILNSVSGNDWLTDRIKSGEPFCAGRIGETELRVCQGFLNKERYSEDVMTFAFQNAGIFPKNMSQMSEFSKEYLQSIKDVDALGVWFNPGEGKVLKKVQATPVLFELRSLEPYYHNNPWSRELKGKKVLIIHPFKDSIISQYKYHDKLFENPNVLPQFELIVFKAIQSISGNCDFASWNDALLYMKEQIAKIDFDIAILGCGAYGLPLATYIKSIGRQAIHMGGSSQILFGIKGKRWDQHPIVSRMYNEYWTRPLDEEKARGADKVEGGTYW